MNDAFRVRRQRIGDLRAVPQRLLYRKGPLGRRVSPSTSSITR
jgi:hypothetical protein